MSALLDGWSQQKTGWSGHEAAYSPWSEIY